MVVLGLRALNNNPQCSEADLRATMEGSGRAVARRLEKYLSALDALAELAQSIRECGVLQPILVRRTPGSSNSFQIIAADHPLEQFVARGAGRAARLGQVLQTEEHALAGAAAHIGGALKRK